MSDEARKEKILALLQERKRLVKYGGQMYELFPEEGPFSRSLYPKQMQFFSLGREKRARIFMAGNRVGKSLAGALEDAFHGTGLYPGWWDGKRFDHPTNIWVAGNTAETVRDSLQMKLLGPGHDIGTGLIPKDLILKVSFLSQPTGAVEQVKLRHVSGGISTMTFKAYTQRREKFQAAEVDVAHLDEEPDDEGIFTECLTRTMTTGGCVYMTFTAGLKGLTPIVVRFMKKAATEGEESSSAIIYCGWDDVPHLTQAARKELLAEYQPYEVRARTTGVPEIGALAVYPVAEEEIKEKPFDIPVHWPRVYALDPGWRRTAGLWAAYDRDTDTIHFYSEYYRGLAEPAVHASAVKARGLWIPGVADNNIDIKNGRSVIDTYRAEGLRLTPAKKSDKEARILDLFQRFSTGRAKVFASCGNFFEEYRLYRRKEKTGQIDPSCEDHLMNCAEYIAQTGLAIAEVRGQQRSGFTMTEETFGLYA